MGRLDLLIAASVAGIIDLLALGGNDVANSQATAVGSGALSLTGAYIVAGICEFLGSCLMGHNVSSTLGEDFVSHDDISDSDYAWGMFFSLVSSGAWILACTWLEMPASSTHSIVGALIGFELVVTDWHTSNLDWSVVWSMMIAWIATPLLGLALSLCCMFGLSYYWPNIDQFRSNSRLNNDNQNGNFASVTPLLNNNDNNNSKKKNGKYNMPPDVNEGDSDSNSWIKNDINMYTDGFQPDPLRFGLLFGIVASSILMFVFVGGPKEVEIYSHIPEWSVLCIFIFTLLISILFGYKLERPYREYYVKLLTKQQNRRFKSSITGIDIKNSFELQSSAKRQSKLNPKANYSGVTETENAKSISDANSETNSVVNDGDSALATELEISVGNNLFSSKNTNTDIMNEKFGTKDYFVIFLVIASGAVSFAHGGNDVANVLGPFGQVYIYYTPKDEHFTVPIWLSMVAGLSIVIGFILFGKNVLNTVGNKITKLTYRGGFAAQFAAAITVLICNVLGIPVSSTTVIVGSVAGVGVYNNIVNNDGGNDHEDEKNILIESRETTISQMARQNETSTDSEPIPMSARHLFHEKAKIFCSKKLNKIDLKTIGKILLTWAVTIPANAAICGVFYGVFKIARKYEH